MPVLQILIQLRPSSNSQLLCSTKPIVVDAGGTATVPLNIAIPAHGKKKYVKTNYRILPALSDDQLKLTTNSPNVSQEAYVPPGNIYPVYIIKVKIRNISQERLTIEEGATIGRLVSIASCNRLKIGLLC